MGVTHALASYASELEFDQLPNEVVSQAKRVILDLCGCILSGHPLPLGKRIVKLGELTGAEPKECTVLGTDLRLSCTAAAYANGALADVMDWNDMLYVGHPATAVVSAALGMGEKLDSSGKEVVEAVVAAYEVFARIGLAVQPTEERQREAMWGMLTWIPFCSAVATGKLMKLDQFQMATAMGIAAAFAPLGGNSKYIETRSDTYHHVHGVASMQGVFAAMHASAGTTGMDTILEGPRGFWMMAYSDLCDWDWLDASLSTLGRDYWILKTLFKKWPANLWVQSYLDILYDLVARHEISYQDIKEITVDPSQGMLMTYRQRGAMDAAFSLPYTLAVALIEPKPGWRWYDEVLLHDPQVLSLVAKVRTADGARVTDRVHEFNNYRRGAWMPAQIDIMTVSGKRYRGHATFPKGHPSNPMSDEELEKKFALAANGTLAPGKAAEAIDLISNLERLESIQELINVLRK
jgi:2-methylcitrate dehydratase PrpD